MTPAKPKTLDPELEHALDAFYSSAKLMTRKILLGEPEQILGTDHIGAPLHMGAHVVAAFFHARAVCVHAAALWLQRHAGELPGDRE